MPQNRRTLLIALPVAFYLLLVAGVFGFMWHRTGQLTYTLDDPYIHMAVARQIQHGGYGVNAGEFTSPSSSVLWPFLLAPAAGNIYLPFLLNFLAGIVSAVLIGKAVSEWPVSAEENRLRRPLTAVALVLIANLVGITFLGMEHGLQVLLALAAAFGICRVLSGRPMPAWAIAAAAIAPAIRYEDLILTLAVGIALIAIGRRRLALLMGAVSIAPLVAFSVFLHGKGLPLLPLSVLVKGKASAAHTNPILTVARLVASGTFHALTDPLRWPLVVLLLIVAAAALRAGDRVRRITLAGATAALVLQMLFGRFGWFHRYEVYALAFAALIVFRLLSEQRPVPLGWYALGLVALVTPYVQAVGESVLSSEDVYGQQFQMHRFASDFYTGNVAVNDLGYVAYGLHPGQYVLDFGGLASVETAREANKSAAWVENMVQSHHVGLVMVYQSMIPIPEPWRRLGSICLARPAIALGGTCVEFFATSPEELQTLQPAFQRFVATLPPQTSAPPLPTP